MKLKSIKPPTWMPAKEMLSDFLKLFSGATIGQLIPFLTGPLLSRLYSPDDFGLYALLSSTAGILSIISTGAYEYAILTADDDDESKQLGLLSVLLSLIFSIFSSLILLIILIIAKPWISSSLAWIWIVVPIYVFLQGLLSASSYTLNRQQRYGRMSKGKLMRSATIAAFQIILGFLKLPWGLFPGMVAGHSAATVYLFHGVKNLFRESVQAASLNNLKTIARKYYRFPSFTLPSQLLNELSVQIPVYLLKAFFTTAIVGIYALPQKMLNVPVSLIGQSIGQVYFQKAAKQKNNPDALATTTASLFRFLFRIGVIPFSIIIVFGDLIFPWLFGAEWKQSGIFAQMLSPWLLFVLAGSPISKLFTVQDKQKLGLYFNSTLITLRVVALLVGGLIFKSEIIAVLLFGLTGFGYWFFQSFYILRMAKVKTLPIFIETVLIWTLLLALLFAIRILIT